MRIVIKVCWPVTGASSQLNSSLRIDEPGRSSIKFLVVIVKDVYPLSENIAIESSEYGSQNISVL